MTGSRAPRLTQSDADKLADSLMVAERFAERLRKHAYADGVTSTDAMDAGHVAGLMDGLRESILHAIIVAGVYLPSDIDPSWSINRARNRAENAADDQTARDEARS